MKAASACLLLLAHCVVSFAQAPPALPQPVAARDEITVTADRSSVPTSQTAKTTYTLDAERLETYPAVTLDESLRQHAGFELFRRASSRVANPTSEGISLRGLGSTAASRTLVLEDGAPLNDPFGGWVHWTEAPDGMVEAVTLVTGGGSDLYGSAAVGGVVDVIPATARPTRLEVRALGGLESSSELSVVAAGTARLAAGLLAAESLRTGGYVAIDPTLQGAVDVPSNVLGQSYRTELGRRGFPTHRIFFTGNLLKESRSNGTVLQTNATGLWRYLAGYDPPETARLSSRLRAFGSAEGYRQSFSAIAAGRNSESLTRLQRVHTQELGAATDATLHFTHLAVVGGADVRDIRASDDETPILRGSPNGFADVTARQRFVGGFGELLGERNGWSGAASLRVDRASNLDILQTTAPSATRPPDRSEMVWSPRAGVVRSLGTAGELHASGFRAFRTPTMNELYRTGQVGQEITLSNAGLQSERATGWEVGVRLAAAPRLAATIQATYFWTEINRPVSAVPIAQTATTITNLRQNLGQILSRGVELSVETRPVHRFSGSAGYQYAEATVTRFPADTMLEGRWIPEVPRHSFTAQLRAGSPRLGSMTLAARAAGRAYDDAANQFQLGSFFSLDLSARRSLGRYGEVVVLIENLTGERAEVARTPLLTLGSPIFAEVGFKFRAGSRTP